MSGSSSGDDSELEPEVPTEVPSDVEVVAASGEGVPGPPGPTVTPPSSAMAPAPAAEALPATPTAEPEALARKQRLVLDKAYRYLLDQGFGVLELASLDLDEVPAMAQQLARELSIPSGGWLEDALYCWLQEAQHEARIHHSFDSHLSSTEPTTFNGALKWNLEKIATPPWVPFLFERAASPSIISYPALCMAATAKATPSLVK